MATLSEIAKKVVEIGGTIDEPDKYKGNFCIIPSAALLEQNVFKTSTCKGKLSVTLCIPEYQRNHWTKKFWKRYLVVQ